MRATIIAAMDNRQVQQRSTWVGLVLLWIALLFNQYWLYASLFFAWGIFDLVTGHSFFVGQVSRRGEPVTYWLIVLTWFAIGALSLVYRQ